MIEIAVFSVASTLLYHLGMGLVFFLIPLQVLFVRRGEKVLVQGLMATFGLLLLVRILTLARSPAGRVGVGPFLVLELFIVAVLLGGLALLNLKLPQLPPMGFVRKLLSITAASGLLSIPLLLYIRGSEGFAEGIRALFQSVSEYLNRSVPQTDGLGLAGTQDLFRPENLINITREVFLRSFLFEYFLLLGFSWWTGSHLGARSLARRAKLTKLIAFRQPDFYVWPVIGSLALILLDTTMDLGVFGFLAWNVGLIFLFLYGLSGIGIIKFLFNKYNLPRGIRWLFATAMIVLLLSPRLNVVFLLLIPALGISEIWIKYRKAERSRESS